MDSILRHFKKSDGDGCSRKSGDLDGLIGSIRDHVITPETMRLFLPKVNWDQVASMYLSGRSGYLLRLKLEQKLEAIHIKIPRVALLSMSLCAPSHIVEWGSLCHQGSSKHLARRSLSSSANFLWRSSPGSRLGAHPSTLVWINWEDPLIKHEGWDLSEEKNLLHAVQQKGMINWVDIAASLGFVASVIEGRTGTQCSNRWIKSLHPALKRCGKWSADEDKRLKVAQYVPGRTHVQCRERWVNSLDPSLKLDEWTKEEDLKLKSAIDEHGYSWSKVAACVPPRTDNQCRRRWVVLCPDEVPMLQEAKKIRREAFISNFVDREEERPALRPNDIVPTPKLSYRAGCQTASANKKRKLRPRAARDDTAPRRRGRTSSLVKRESRAIASQGSSSSLANLSSSMTVVEEAESLVQDSKKAKNIKKDKRHSTSEYDPCIISPQGPPLGTADLDVGENVNVSAIPGTLEGENSGASGSLNVASGQSKSKAMAGAHPGRSCVSGGHNGMERELPKNAMDVGAEVEDDAPLSFLMRRVRPRQH
ncbi:Myb-like DNA-binding domain protein [Datura stramonium]|uniref:Myb-like DNA-binding domain protein n=1 Tax=Datura stramonium TaxID=4076 RepID=A0ABS8RIN1_DATST|nr:Myb-like DNA-binding domain protein [Datura stramonium]